jgi:hypothetical protein
VEHDYSIMEVDEDVVEAEQTVITRHHANTSNIIQKDHESHININDLVDILEPSADEAPYHFPPDEDYTQTFTLQPISSRNHFTRKRNLSQKVIDNLIPIDELPLESEEVYVNNVFIIFPTVPTSYSDALRRPDTPKWVKAMEKQLKLLRKAGTWEFCIRSDIPAYHRILKSRWVYTIKRNGLYKAK